MKKINCQTLRNLQKKNYEISLKREKKKNYVVRSLWDEKVLKMKLVWDLISDNITFEILQSTYIILFNSIQSYNFTYATVVAEFSKFYFA